MATRKIGTGKCKGLTGVKLKACRKRNPIKTRSASKVLKLMDKDVSYSRAVKRVMKSDKITKTKLEKELDPFI